MLICFYSVFHHVGAGKKRGASMWNAQIHTCPTMLRWVRTRSLFCWSLTQITCRCKGVKVHKNYPQTSNRKIPSFIQTHKNIQDYSTDLFYAAANVEHWPAESLSLPVYIQLPVTGRRSRCQPSCKLEESLGRQGEPREISVQNHSAAL